MKPLCGQRVIDLTQKVAVPYGAYRPGTIYK